MADLDFSSQASSAPSPMDFSNQATLADPPGAVSQAGSAITRGFGDIIRGAAAGSSKAYQQLKADINAPTDMTVGGEPGLVQDLTEPLAPAAHLAQIAMDVPNIAVQTAIGAFHPLAQPAGAALLHIDPRYSAEELAAMTPEQRKDLETSEGEEFQQNAANVAFAAEGGVRGAKAPEVNPEQFAPQPAKSAYTSTVAPSPVPTGPLIDSYVAQSPTGAILDAFGQGPANNWGTQDITAGLDTNAVPASTLGRIAQTQAEVTKSFNEAFQRAAAAKISVQADTHTVYNIAIARAFGVIGEDEGGWSGVVKPDDNQLAARVEAAGVADPAPEAPAFDIHAAARQIAPEVFEGPEGYDALDAQRQTLRNSLADITERHSAEATQDIDAKLAEFPGEHPEQVFDKAAGLHDERQAILQRIRTQGDTPEIADLRRAILETDYKMRDLSPQVSAAYREAQERGPVGAPAVAQEAAQAIPAIAEQPAPESIQPSQQVTPTAIDQAKAEEQAKPAAPSRPVPASVAADVSQKLAAAGRPAEEANAAGALVAAHYDARAARFGGALGTGPELYAREAPEVRAGRVRAAAREKEFAQGVRGKIAIRDAGNVITLMKDANASTFIHETGHQWLDEMVRDAKDERARADLTKDAQTVRDYLGTKDGEAISPRQHEKFARSFERYMMEGTAPSRGLADVFAKFKGWLTQIYQTVTKLRAPITDDIRQVFDRLLTKPGDEAVIAPDRLDKSLADLHEVDALHTIPEHADPVRDNVEQEVVQVAERKTPDIAPDLTDGGKAGGVPAETSGNPDGTGPAGAGPGSAGNAEESGKVADGGGNAGAEGPNVGTKSDAGGGASKRSEPEQAAGTRRTDFTPNVIDKAGNIRLDNLNLPEDVDDALRQIARENDDFNAQRFGDEGRQLHGTILAARKLTQQASIEMAEARARAASDTATEQDLKAYQEAANRLTMVAGRLAMLTHDWGYAGQAFRMMEGLPDNMSVRTMAELADRTKGMTLFQLKNEAKLGESLETPEQQQKFLLDARMTKWDKAKSMIIELFVNNLISGPITHMAYSIGTKSMSLFRAVPVTAVQAGLSTLKGADAGDRVYFGEIGAQLYAHAMATPDAWSAARRAWKTGIAEPLPGEELSPDQAAQQAAIESGEEPKKRQGAIPGKIGEVIRLPSDSVAAIHSFNSLGAYAQEIARLAYRSASDAGLSGDAHAIHMAKFLENPPDDAMEAARNEAYSSVLMSPAKYGSDFYKFKQIVNNNLALKLIAPFMQIGANILHTAFLDYTPLGVLDSTIRDNLSGKNGEIAKTMQQGKIATGVTLATAVIGMTLNGNLSGGGPSDLAARSLKMRGGWQPYSLKFGNYWIPYRKFLGPVGTLIAGVSDMTEVAHSASDGDLATAAKSAVFGLSEVVADESWFSGVSNFVDAARNWDKPEGERYVRNMATAFIPFSVGLSQVARLVDPYQRQVRSIVDAARAKIPEESTELLPRRDVWGNPMPSRLMISPSQITNDPVDQELDRLGKYPRQPDRKIVGVPLTDQQYDDYSRLAGQQAHMALRAMFASPDWNSVPDGQKIIVIDRAIEKARSDVRANIKMASHGTTNDIAKQASDKKQAQMTRGSPAKP